MSSSSTGNLSRNPKTAQSKNARRNSKDDHSIKSHKIRTAAWVLGLCILTVVVIAIIVTTAIALVLMIQLRSELSLVQELSQANVNSSHDLMQFHKLHSDFNLFASKTKSQLNVLRDLNNGYYLMLNSSNDLLLELQTIANQLFTNFSFIEKNFNDQLRHISNDTDLDLMKFRLKISENITNSSTIAQRKINILTNSLVSGIQAHHMFDSCDAVAINSLPLPSGMYMIGSTEDTAAMQYCITDVSYSCNGTAGVWKRVAGISEHSKFSHTVS